MSNIYYITLDYQKKIILRRYKGWQFDHVISLFQFIASQSSLRCRFNTTDSQIVHIWYIILTKIPCQFNTTMYSVIYASLLPIFLFSYKEGLTRRGDANQAKDCFSKKKKIRPKTNTSFYQISCLILLLLVGHGRTNN